MIEEVVPHHPVQAMRPGWLLLSVAWQPRRRGAVLRIEDYGLIGDMNSAALVGRDGSVDWLCLPRFDSASCFTGLLGDERNGRWRVAPAGEAAGGPPRLRPRAAWL